MRADDDHGQDVEAGQKRVGQSLELLAIAVASSLGPRVLVAPAVVKRLDVNHQEREQPEARHDHRRRRQRLAARLSSGPLHLVPGGPGLLVREEHLYRFVNVDEENEKQSYLDGPQEKRLTLERVRVEVECCGACENYQVSGDMHHEVEEKSEAGEPDENLGPYGGREDS